MLTIRLKKQNGRNGRHLETLFWTFLPELKGLWTWKLVGCIRVTCMLHSLIARRRVGPQTQSRPLRKILTSGLGLDDMSFTWPKVVQLLFLFTLTYSRISHEFSSLSIIVIKLIFMFSLWYIDWVGSLYANLFFMYFCIKSSIGTQVKLAGCENALTPSLPSSSPPPPPPHPPPPPPRWFVLL